VTQVTVRDVKSRGGAITGQKKEAPMWRLSKKADRNPAKESVAAVVRLREVRSTALRVLRGEV
jgi:hypothetical protein